MAGYHISRNEGYNIIVAETHSRRIPVYSAKDPDEPTAFTTSADFMTQ